MKASTCRPELIAEFLADRLSVDEQRLLEEHLDSCDTCCDALQDQTATAELWQETQSLLTGTSTAEPAHEPSDHVSLDFLSPTDDPHRLGRFGGYEIAGVIGSGGMGIVLKGFDPALNRYAAIKVLAPHYAGSGAARQRFAREAQAAAAVVHDNVIAIHGVDECNGLPYLVMPYVKGESLAKRIRRCGPLETSEILRIGLQMARGLSAAHDQGLVHRDIKPANILLPENVERVLITDFGLARAADDASLTRSGVIAGTPQYMSPEQARGEGIDTRSDLFSLGSVLYTLCTGHSPFRAETPYGILRRITDNPPRPVRELNAQVPDWLVQIVDKLLQKDPQDRFASAAETAEVLEECLAHYQQPDVAPLPEQLQPSAARGRRIGKWIAAGGTLLLVVAGLLLLQPDEDSGSGRATRPPTHNPTEGAAVRQEPHPPDRSAAPTEATKVIDATELDWHDDSGLDAVETTLDELDAELRSELNDHEIGGN